MSAGGAQVGPGLRAALLAEGILVETSVPGLYHRSEAFESVVRGVEAVARRLGREAGGFEPLTYLPPVMPRDTFDKTDYLRSFPDLIGAVSTFQGGDAEHAELMRAADAGDDWTGTLSASEVTLCSAACHSIYPSLGGRLPRGGRYVELQGFCFRHEPSRDPVRMQTFRMHEMVHVGTPQSAVAHRDLWLQRGVDALSQLGLPVERVVAVDPFFGRAGRMLMTDQRETELKYEIVCHVSSTSRATAICSANYHRDHFGGPFGIVTHEGEVAHSACFGFGLERVALALFAVHGLDCGSWPASVRNQLWP